MKGNRGEIDGGILTLIALCIIIFVFIIPQGKLGPVGNIFNTVSNTNSWNPSNNLNTSNTNPSLKLNSAFASLISINSGSAGYAQNPWGEYVIFQSQGNTPIDITGWTFKNNMSNKTYVVGGNVKYFQSDIEIIPKVATYLSPTGNNIFKDIVLNNGDEAIVTTGSTGVTIPYKLVNFRENICSGYLDSSNDYGFNPPLQRSCPLLRNEPGINGLDSSCQDYLNGISGCYIPKYDTVDQNGNICNGCVDGRSNLTGICVAFIKQHANYASCIANHKDDANFSLNIWRVFLGKTFPIWDKSNEIISLFDNQGKLVNSYSY
jgi:hypothetical protein